MCSRAFRKLLAATQAPAQFDVSMVGSAFELAGMVGAGDRDLLVAGRDGGLGLEQFLELPLGVDEVRQFVELAEVVPKQSTDHPGGLLESTVQEHGPHDRLEPVGKGRRPGPSTRRLLTPTEDQVISEPQLPPLLRQRGAVDHLGPRLGQGTLPGARKAAVQLQGDHQLEHGVTQEFEPLVVLLECPASRFVGQRRVRQGQNQQVRVPEEVTQWYKQDRQRMANIESEVLEQNVVDWFLARAKVTDKTVAQNLVTYVNDNGSKIQTDFHFDLADSSYTRVPWWIVPNSGKAKFTNLAALWKVCVREVMKANGISQNFVIGFTLDSQATATHSMKNGVSCYMLNPKSKEIDSGSKQEKVMAILTVACHEVVHSQGCQYHDENFVRKFHDLLVPTLTKAPSWRQLVKLAKAEKV